MKPIIKVMFRNKDNDLFIFDALECEFVAEKYYSDYVSAGEYNSQQGELEMQKAKERLNFFGMNDELFFGDISEDEPEEDTRVERWPYMVYTVNCAPSYLEGR